MEYIRAKAVSLKDSSEFSEKWLQEILAADPEILGLGDITLRDTERTQSSGGRLDLLFEDDTSSTRYCVELQLGATDETHIIRTLEYWDIERSRNPHLEHIAVIGAEDVTSRFLNVIALFNKSVPIVAIQLNAFEIEGKISLTATKVLDLTTTIGWEEDGTAVGFEADRNYWLKRGSEHTVQMVDQLFDLIRDVTRDNSLEQKYNKQYIGLARHGVADNFVTARARKNHIQVEFRIPRQETLTEELENAFGDINYRVRNKQYRFQLQRNHFDTQKELIRRLIQEAAGIEDIRTESFSEDESSMHSVDGDY